MEEVFVYETEKAIVRFHYGKRTKEEVQKAVEEAAIDFFTAICREGKEHLIDGIHESA